MYQPVAGSSVAPAAGTRLFHWTLLPWVRIAGAGQPSTTPVPPVDAAGATHEPATWTPSAYVTDALSRVDGEDALTITG